MLAGQEKKFIDNLLGALGQPELAALCLKGPGPHQQPVIDFLAATFKKKTRDEWSAWIAKLDVCYGPVNTLPEALEDPNLKARGMVLTDEMGRRHLGAPIRFGNEPAKPNLQEPALDEHGQKLLGAKRRRSG